MDTDGLVERFIQQARAWEALPDGLTLTEDYQIVHPNLYIRDEERVRIKLRSIVNGFGGAIIITKSAGGSPGHITVWSRRETPKPAGQPVSLITRVV